MISVTESSVKKALREIDREGISKANRSRYCLVAGKHYPPKEVLKRAYRYEHGKQLLNLHGGPQTNIPLQNARCKVVPHGCGNTCKVV